MGTVEDILTIDQDSSVSMDINAQSSDVYISIENEWCGDSQSGFGANVSISLNYKQAIQVYEFIGKWINLHDKEINWT